MQLTTKWNKVQDAGLDNYVIDGVLPKALVPKLKHLGVVVDFFPAY